MAKLNPGLLKVEGADLLLLSFDGKRSLYGTSRWVRAAYALVAGLVAPFMLVQASRGWTLGGVPYLLEVVALAAAAVGLQQLLKRGRLLVHGEGWLRVETGFVGRPRDRRVDLTRLQAVCLDPCRVRRMSEGKGQVLDGTLVVLEFPEERLELVAFADEALADSLARTIQAAASDAHAPACSAALQLQGS